ncbi:GumC family protein [Flavitalea sp.]|nr:Wzz/FepE/Etk N-terminal domain-containing protein [Flavitalea sp.]
MELVYIFRLLYRKKWIILTCTLISMVAAFVFTLNDKKMYKSLAQVSTGFTVSEELKLTDGTFNLSQIDVNFNNAVENINSAKVLSLLSYRLILHDLTAKDPYRTPKKLSPSSLNVDKTEAARVFANKYDSIAILNSANEFEKKLIALLEDYEYDVAALKSQLFVGRHLRTDFIDFLFRSENPELSAYVVNTLFKEYQRYTEAFRRERSIESMVALDSSVRKKKQEMDSKLELRSRFIGDSISSIDPNVLGANQLTQISQYESYLADENAKSLSLNYQLRTLNKQLKDSDIPVTPVSTSDNNSEYFALRRQYSNLMDEYVRKGSNDPELKGKLDDIHERMKLKAPLSAATPNTPVDANNQKASLVQQRNNAEGELQAANAKINFYTRKLAELRNALVVGSPNSSSSLGRFEKEVEIATAEYTSAKEKYNIASNMNEGASSNFKQTVYGQPALQPEKSRRILVLATSGLSAFLLSSLAFVFLGFVDQSIKTPSQFNRQTGLPLLGIINFINLKSESLKDRVTILKSGDHHRNNAFRELLRKMRYEIESSGKHIFLFTSTEPQQGKTTLIQALAFSLSLGKKKVLLIDTNFCNNDLTLQVSARETLEEFSGNGQIGKEELESIITETAVNNVYAIGCKGGDYTPSEILPYNHFLKYLPQLLDRFDYIFMESAPLNGFTDTKELVQYAEGVIAIFSATAEVKHTDKESIKYLAQLEGKFLGAILNKVEKPDISL